MTLSIVRNRGGCWRRIGSLYTAGYGEQQVLEIILGLSQKVIINQTTIANTPVDGAFQNCLEK
jgi:hypothetical protein